MIVDAPSNTPTLTSLVADNIRAAGSGGYIPCAIPRRNASLAVATCVSDGPGAGGVTGAEPAGGVANLLNLWNWINF
jgi:hypothetical protein